MTLAEALILRSDTQKRIAQLAQRVQRNALVQQGDTPAEDPNELLREFEHDAEALRILIERINRTNTATEVRDGVSLTEALAHRDVLRLRVNLYRELAKSATVTQSRMTRSEVKFVSTVTVSAVQKQADALAKEYRELDAAIQATNWRAVLME